MNRILTWLRDLFVPEIAQYQESTLDLLKRKAVERGLDPGWFDELANLPTEPTGPDDPGPLKMGKRLW